MASARGKLSEKDLEVHREYMKKYKMQSSDLSKAPMKYKDHYDTLGVSREATHTEVRRLACLHAL
jgi:hypothetical protein